ncbi:hypothetical protein [Pleionea litopenaei]|uniref:Uncharacterized protein n=1 Tax=Pleionea litopenaei TaxID=3070815 RepID=A0AA51RUB8_9GAMM|nr:hypothetical protein [Pleionea sp. HL-JVS1]WMS87813.1 hypothetical protein Q9312_02535 [Pleionea sp. HL-JVS1]
MSSNTHTTMSQLTCPHGGSITIASSNTSVFADQSSVATISDTFTVVGCPFQIPGTPPIPSPCVTVQWIKSDLRVKVSGQFTVSAQSVGLCLSAQQLPQGQVMSVNTQLKVSSQ